MEVQAFQVTMQHGPGNLIVVEDNEDEEEGEDEDPYQIPLEH